MNLEELKNKYQLINLFVELAEIPSPSKKEEKVSKRIMELLNLHNINAQFDNYGNIIAKIPASSDYKNVPPLLLSAHMDVVGGSQDVNVRLSNDRRYIETDKTRTLGADDKAGVAAILDLAIEMNDLNSQIMHGPIEIIFTRDEETGMTGITNLNTALLKSKYAVIIDGENLGEHNNEGAGFTNVFVKVHSGKGGHSGINISDKTRINAIKVLSGLDSQIPQGVYKEDERGVVTSINAGVSIGGTADVLLSETLKNIKESDEKKLPEKYLQENIFKTIIDESAFNVINTNAAAGYSIRSSDPQNEQELINLIKQKVKDINHKYNGFIQVDLEIKTHLKPFVKSADTFLSEVIVKSGNKLNINAEPKSFHAGAETHVLANEKKNANNESFVPVIIGVANLHNIHSADEKLDWQSFLKGREWLEEIVRTFASESC